MPDLKRGDGDAFAVLFDRYNRLVLTVALRIIRDAGHKNMENHDDGPRVLAQTRQYILDFQELAEKTTTANELYDQMLARYPEWLNRGALWSSAIAIKK